MSPAEHLWSRRRARRFLDEAAHQAAAEPGTSDRTLVRIATLAHPEEAALAASSPRAFRAALRRAGWSPRRIARAVAEVRYGRAGAALVERFRRVRPLLRQPRVLLGIAFVLGALAPVLPQVVVSVGLAMLVAWALGWLGEET